MEDGRLTLMLEKEYFLKLPIDWTVAHAKIEIFKMSGARQFVKYGYEIDLVGEPRNFLNILESICKDEFKMDIKQNEGMNND